MRRLESLESRRLLSSTDLDTSFSNDGLVTTDFAGDADTAAAVALQRDGKIVVAGDAVVTGKDGQIHHAIAAVRYNADGTLDDGGNSDSTPGDSFSTAGKFTYYEGLGSTANAIAIQNDGKIVIAGSSEGAGSLHQQYWTIVRLNTNGSFDKTFGVNGRIDLEFSLDNTPLAAVAVQGDGKIVAAGTENGDWLVARFNTDGSFDNTFGAGGSVTTDFGGTDTASGIAFDNIGNIIVGGVANGSLAAAARYQPDGTLDPNFGHNGLATQAEDGTNLGVGGVVVQPDGVISLGFTFLFAGHWDGGNTNFSIDGSFGGSNSIQELQVSSIALMPDGDLVNGAIDHDPSNSGLGAIIDGVPGATFDTNTTGTAVAAAPDGSVFVAGYINNGGSNLDFMLAKFKGVDPTTWGSVSGNVFRDLDDDHVLDSNERGMSNVRVYVDANHDGQFTIDSQGNPEPSALTDAHGNFTITGIFPFTDTIREVVPPSTTQSLPLALSYLLTVSGGKAIRNINFANAPIVTPSTKTAINGSVFFDWNGNTLRDVSNPVEPDLAGVVVFVDANRNGRLDKGETQATTDASGNYSLGLPKNGAYRVEVVTPAGYANSTPALFDVTVHTHQQVSEHFGLTYADTNDTEKEAIVTRVGSVVAGKLASPLDVNMYRFTVKAGQTILFDEDAATGSSLNSELRLFDSGGHQLAANDNAAAPGESAGVDSFLQYTFATAGTYYIGISDHLNIAYSPRAGIGDIGGGTKGGYTLRLALS